MAKGKLVEVTWIDAHSYGGASWTAYDDDAKAAMSRAEVCTSVGFIFHQSKESLAIVASVSYDKDGGVCQIGGHMTIPRSMIKKVRTLK